MKMIAVLKVLCEHAPALLKVRKSQRWSALVSGKI
jgi:hypothetical protein